jgi:hypothetical protein
MTLATGRPAVSTSAIWRPVPVVVSALARLGMAAAPDVSSRLAGHNLLLDGCRRTLRPEQRG